MLVLEIDVDGVNVAVRLDVLLQHLHDLLGRTERPGAQGQALVSKRAQSASCGLIGDGTVLPIASRQHVHRSDLDLARACHRLEHYIFFVAKKMKHSE